MNEVLSGVLGGLFSGASISVFVAPWINWGIEKRKQKLAYKRDLIASWRKMLHDLWQKYYPVEGHGPMIQLEIMNHKDFYSLKPHLDPKIQEKLEDEAHVRTLIQLLTDEVGKIEQKWELI